MARLQVGEVIHGLDGVGGGAAAATEELGAHQLDVPADTGHAHAIAADAADGAGHVGTVIVGSAIKHGAVVAVEIPAIHVIDQTVAIIVAAIAGDFTRILVGIGGQIGVIEHVAFIDDADHDSGAVGFVGGPGHRGLRAEGTGHAPELAGDHFRIVRGGGMADQPVRFGEINRRIIDDGIDFGGHLGAGREIEAHQFQIAVNTLLAAFAGQHVGGHAVAEGFTHARLVGGGGEGAVLDDQLAGRVLLALGQALLDQIRTAAGIRRGRNAQSEHGGRSQ